MAALDCFVELDPVDLGVASPACSPAPLAAASAGAPAGAAGVWLWKQQQLKLAAPAAVQQAAVLTEEEDEASECTVSPGCSYSGAAAEGASLLDLADDACSSQALLQASPTPLEAAPSQSVGLQAAAATFFDDLAAGGSLYQYCLRR